ncbi:hypothetical protein ABZ635_22185 [Nocardiopsis sp. NPDC007018]|uniref:hypothetical protein n=1 Tax=Nocardiopsis sp. NPDC007018 TaxID=3155721 RepID=UPI0033F7C49E
MINLKDGSAVRGVLYRRWWGGTAELRDAVRLEMGREPVNADGAILIERPEILYWQVVAP